MEARTLMDVFTAAESLDGVDPQAVKKRAAVVVNTIMELIIFFIYDPFLFPHRLVRDELSLQTFAGFICQTVCIRELVFAAGRA